METGVGPGMEGSITFSTVSGVATDSGVPSNNSTERSVLHIALSLQIAMWLQIVMSLWDTS